MFSARLVAVTMMSPSSAKAGWAAASVATALERLEVQVSDLDVIVTEDRRFLLMDLGFYDRGPTKAAPMTRQLQNMLGGVVRAVP